MMSSAPLPDNTEAAPDSPCDDMDANTAVSTSNSRIMCTAALEEAKQQPGDPLAEAEADVLPVNRAPVIRPSEFMVASPDIDALADALAVHF